MHWTPRGRSNARSCRPRKKKPMKRLLQCSLWLLLILTLKADQEWIIYNANLRIPWANNPAYTRTEFDWWIGPNDGQPSDLYLNGVYQGSEYGTNTLRIDLAWAIHPQGVTIGIVDVNSAHGQRVKAVAEKVTRNQAFLSNSLRLYPDDIASGISNFAAMRFPIIVVTTGFSSPHAGLSNACRFAELRNALVFCAVPNTGANIDVTPDYPGSWAGQMVNIVPVTSTDRTGNLYGPGAAATGSLVIGAPGRNIICDTNYTSGTSMAAPIAAGCMAILIQYKRGRSAEIYRNALWSTSEPATGVRRINAKRLLETEP